MTSIFNFIGRPKMMTAATAAVVILTAYAYDITHMHEYYFEYSVYYVF